MQDIYEKLEFEKVREKIAKYAKTEIGKELATSLVMLPDADSNRKELSFLDEMISVFDRYGRVPLDVSSDLSKAVELAKKGGTLSIEELERTAHDVLEGKSIKQFFRQVTLSPLLLEYVGTFPPLEFLEKDIHKVIAPDMSIFDNASPKLKSIRLAMTRLENEMKKKLGFIVSNHKEFLSDTTLTIKNGIMSCLS